MILKEEQIILKPIDNLEKNWEKAFQEMSKNNDEELFFNVVFEDKKFEKWN